MTLEEAILSLPKIDKRWRSVGWNMVAIKRKNDDFVMGAEAKHDNTIEDLHAAAKSIGMEIDYRPLYELGVCVGYAYSAFFYKKPLVDDAVKHIRTLAKTPALAVRAAFIAAIEYKLKEDK